MASWNKKVAFYEDKGGAGQHQPLKDERSTKTGTGEEFSEVGAQLVRRVAG